MLFVAPTAAVTLVLPRAGHSGGTLYTHRKTCVDTTPLLLT